VLNAIALLTPPHMLSQDEFDELLGIIENASDLDDQLSDWEIDFIKDFADRVAKYGPDTNVSDKQWDVLRRIDDRLNRI
jgi:hypothetical protein